MHEHIDEMGIINMNGRIYDPLIGRFMSADPYIQAPDDLQSFNRYAYVRNNPLNLTDPSGFFSWRQEWRNFKKNVVKYGLRIGAGIADGMGCGGYCSAIVAGWETSQLRDANGKRLGARGFVLGFGSSLLGQYVPVEALPILNIATGCGVGHMAGGSCRRGAFDAATTELFGPIVGGCVNAVRGGGKCGEGAFSGLRNKWGNDLTNQAVSAGIDYLNEGKKIIAEERRAAEEKENTILLACACGETSNPNLDYPTSDAGYGGYSAQPSIPILMDVRILFKVFYKILDTGYDTLQWVLSAKQPENVTYPDNPDNSDFDKVRGTNGWKNPEDGSIWERDFGNHGRKDGDKSSWKRWKNRSSWERRDDPNTIWPDGRIRK